MTPPPAARARATNVRIHVPEAELGDAPARWSGTPATAVPDGRDVVGGDLVAELEQHRARSTRSSGGRPRGTGLMFGPLDDLDRGRLRRRQRAGRGRRVGGGAARPGSARLGRRAGRARIGDHAGERGRRGGQRRAQIDLVVLHAAPAREVAVEGAQAAGARWRARGRCPRRRRRSARRSLAPAARRSASSPSRAIISRMRLAAREDHEGDVGARRAARAGRSADRRACPPTSSWCTSRP